MVTAKLIEVIITILLTIISGLIALAYRDIRESLQKYAVQLHNTQRIIFVLVSKLHPDKSAVIATELQDFFNNNGRK